MRTGPPNLQTTRLFLALVFAMGCAPFAAAQEPSALETAAAVEKLTTDAIASAERSVVSIARVRRDGDRPPALPEEAPPLLLPGLGIPEPTDPSFVPTEFATGVVIDAKGLIVTTYHALGDLKTPADFYVWLARKPYLAKVKAADAWLDLAVLQVDSVELKPIALGDAKSLKKGQFVIALGNPYAIARDGQPSASWGIISNLERQAPAPRTGSRPSEGRDTLHHWGTLIQTDARLELGASGGALVNLKGEMIGLTTSLAALMGYERPGGFAIPVDDDFKRALDTLKTGRVPDYGFLGISPRYLAMRERQRDLFGARVDDVIAATPAAAAGLRTGDIITHVEKEQIFDDMQLIRRVSGYHADQTITLAVLRGQEESRRGKPLEVAVTLSKKRLAGSRDNYSEAPAPIWRGMRVEYATAMPLFQEQCRDLDPAGAIGVLSVERDSPAWKAGLRGGDFISHVGDTRITTPSAFHTAVAPLPGEVALKLTATESDSATRIVPAP